ncbi:MAG: hypothetical protein NTW98_01175 [Candidatus Nomurabacteria bacterium]|nr:hypothetical protein [Candidatus Nomurabacteria bacterium]
MNERDTHGQNGFKDMKDSSTDTSLSVSDTEFSLSYKKTNKLVTALFMVTDMIEKEEPVRNKLRTLGVEILSDTVSISRTNIFSRTDKSLGKKVQEVIYFLDLALTINLISDMNASVLKKEFKELHNSFYEYLENSQNFAGKATLSEFFKTEEKFSITPPIRHENYSIGHINSTRIGVQKGSTLMKALSDKILARPIAGAPVLSTPKIVSDRLKNKPAKTQEVSRGKEDFGMLKKQRRTEILDIIKKNAGSAEGTSITDIKSVAKGTLLDTSEKTLQRELVSMVKDSVLKKNGSKRWSRYFVV